jgi:hypothetical protein
MTMKATGCSGKSVPGGRTGRWTPFEEGGQVGEIPELLLVPRRLGAVGQRLADLGDDHADLVGGDLHPGELLYRVDRPELEPQTGHEQDGLIAGLPVEGDRVVVGQLLCREQLGDQADLRGTDRMDGLQGDDQQRQSADDRHVEQRVGDQ